MPRLSFAAPKHSGCRPQKTGHAPSLPNDLLLLWRRSRRRRHRLSIRSIRLHQFHSRAIWIKEIGLAFAVHAGLDHPDVASLAAPDCALFVLNCGRDELFTAEGMRLATEKMRGVYQDLNHADRFQAHVYDVPHLFNKEMQKDAFFWLDRWLK